MVEKKKNQTEAERWKDKYFVLAEEFDKKKASAKEYADILQRTLVRVSLAADGLDNSLDLELEGLRGQLRGDAPSKAALSSRLGKIEKAVLSLDEQKDQDANVVLNSLKSLVEQLLKMDLARDQKKQLKRLSSDLKGKQNSLKEYPQLLSQYAALQASAIQAQFAESSETQSGGFFQRIFGGGDGKAGAEGKSTEENVSTSTNTQEGDFIPHTTEVPESIELAPEENAHKRRELTYIEQATELDITVNDDSGDINVPGFSTISKRVSGALNHLVGQLTIPKESEIEAEKIQTQINKGLNWYELGPTLDDVANLVISAVNKAQNEFEGFLKGLDARLAKLQGFLIESGNQQIGWKGNSLELDQSVRSQVSSISQEVADATDLNELKSSVEVHLDSIIHSMDTFVVSEEKREQESNEQVDMLKQRLQAMEGEASEIRERLHEEHKRALTDTLTQLPNREAYNERMDLEFDRWQRYRQPTTMVVGDIDFFKRVNDQYGHLAGDKVLQIISKEIKNRIRKTDFLARFGGEEFVILMPETGVEMAETVMDKTREMIGRLPFHFRDEDVKITMSFGIVPFLEAATAAELFELADRALYRAKEEGRDRVVVGDPN